MNVWDEAWSVEEKAKALHELKTAKKRRERAAEAYEEALFRCVELDISNVVMARHLGVSETAVRLYRKRKGNNI